MSIPISRSMSPKMDGPKKIKRAIPATRGGRESGRLIIRPMNRDVGNVYLERAYATGRATAAQSRVEIIAVKRDNLIAKRISSEVNARMSACGSGQSIRPPNTKQNKSIRTPERTIRKPWNQDPECGCRLCTMRVRCRMSSFFSWSRSF